MNLCAKISPLQISEHRNDMTAEATQLNHLAGHQDQKLRTTIAEGKLHKLISTLPTDIYQRYQNYTANLIYNISKRHHPVYVSKI